MGVAGTLLYAFIAGLTVTGIAASVMELFAQRSVRFSEPFVSRSRIVRSLAAAAAAGPFMLMNDALSAFGEKRISALELASCACASAAWALASGIIALSLASHATRPLT